MSDSMSPQELPAPAIPREGAPKGALCAACSTDHTGDELGEDCIVEFKGRERIFYCDDYCRGRYDERTSGRSSLPVAPSDTLTVDEAEAIIAAAEYYNLVAETLFGPQMTSAIAKLRRIASGGEKP